MGGGGGGSWCPRTCKVDPPPVVRALTGGPLIFLHFDGKIREASFEGVGGGRHIREGISLLRSWTLMRRGRERACLKPHIREGLQTESTG